MKKSKKKKLKKKLKRNKKNIIRLFVTAVVAELICVLYLLCILYFTQPATDFNTFKVTAVIDKAVLDNRFWSKSPEPRRVIMCVNGKNYLLDLEFDRNYSTKQVKELCSKLNSTDKEFVLTVWKHYSRDLFDERYFFKKDVEQIVDIRDDVEILYECDSFNKYQKRDRVFGIIASILIWIVVSVVIVIYWKVIML